MRLLKFPPPLQHSMTWRGLCRSDALIQRELVVASTFTGRVAARGVRWGGGDGPLAELHTAGALRPVAFVRGGPYIGPLTAPRVPDESISFSDEHLSPDWNDYAVEMWGHPHVTALYSPWQYLVVEDVSKGGRIDLPLSVVADEHDARPHAWEQLRELAQTQRDRWSQLDDAWRPLLQVLVRLQNRYLPDLTRRHQLLFDPEAGHDIDPFDAEVEAFAPTAVFEHELGEDRDGLLAAYEFLMERAINLDPTDGLTMLRRARPRAFHIRWEGRPRLAQDHFDAADLLRRFLKDLAGVQPAQPAAIPLDGRQLDRAELYRRGPGHAWTGPEVVAALQEAELYPHGVHVVHEGKTDKLMVRTIVGALLGQMLLEEVAFTDLKGVGSSEMLPDLVGSLSGYARQVVVIVDNEAKATAHVEKLVESGALPRDNVLLFETSNEEEDSSDAELVQIAIGLAVAAGEQLALTRADLRAFHEKRVIDAREHNRETPGLATSLQQLIKKRTHGRWHLRKRDLAVPIAELIVTEMLELPEDQWTRPLPTFIAQRILPPLNRPRPAGPS